MTEDWTSVTVRWWRAVNNETDGIAFDASDRNDGHAAKLKVETWCETTGHGRYHVEEWEQTYTVSPSAWTRVTGRSTGGSGG
jgi:hypothetical protein